MREHMVKAFKRGWHLIPLLHNSKKPNLPKDHKFLTMPPLREDYANFKFDNYGIVCGRMSDITVIDVDFPEGTRILHELGVEVEGIETPQVYTPNGRHLFFQYDANVRTGVGIMGKGIDVRNDGSYVVGAGSVVGGEVYAWHEIYGPDTPLAVVPRWVLEERKRSGGIEWKMTTRLGKGERNTKLMSLAGALVSRELPAQLVLECVSLINEKWCDNPLDEEEVEKIVKSADSYRNEASSG